MRHGARTRFLAMALLGLLGAACGRDDAPPAEDVGFADTPTQLRVVDFDSYLELEVGDPPRAIWAIMERDVGVHDSVRVLNVTVADSTVLRVRDGAIVGLRAGRSNFYIEVEGLRHRGHAFVAQRIARDSVTLAPGEVRAWDLGVGQYDVAVRPITRNGAPSPLELAADITCATDGRDSELLHCLVRKPTRFLLRHSSARLDAGRASALVSIKRVP